MQTIERRAQRRLPLRWQMRLSSQTIGSVETCTENLSASSFYCVLDEPPPLGEKMNCDMTIPTSGYRRTVGGIMCEAEVVRVDARQTGFGVACRILDFQYMRKHTAATATN